MGSCVVTVISNNCNYYGNEPAGLDVPPPTHSPSLVSWTLEPGICRQNGNEEDGAPVRQMAKTTCRKGGTVSPATAVYRGPQTLKS